VKILVTAGNTQTPIDRVRCITNIFTGRTGALIAAEAVRRQHSVVLLTSHPEAFAIEAMPAARVRTYRTFDELASLMETEIPHGDFDAIIHCAAVSDYELAGTYTLAAGTTFDANSQSLQAAEGQATFADAARSKVKSSHDELWLRLTPTPKLADRIRRDWTFRGILVKFKLEVGIDEPELERIAAASRRQSDADVIVANTLEGMHAWATIGNRSDRFTRVERPRLAAEILNLIEVGSSQRGRLLP